MNFLALFDFLLEILTAWLLLILVFQTITALDIAGRYLKIKEDLANEGKRVL